MRILVTGGRGFIGRAIVPLLEAQGHEVFAPRRGENGFPADLATLDSWDGWPADIDAVVHLAALNPERGAAAAQDDAALMRANVAGTKALAERAAREGVRRFVLASTLLVHPFSPRPIRESDAAAPQNAYAGSKLAAEDALAQALAGTGTEPCVLRLAPVYGPGGRGGVQALLRLAQGGLPLPFGGGAPRSLLSLGNAASALAFALASDKTAGETFLVADSEALPLGEIVARVRRLRGRPAWVLDLPQGLVGGLARALGKGAAYQRLFAGLAVDGAKLRRAGWTPPETLDEGLRRFFAGSDRG
ncbi:NAD-dependent epimerase/dehydratase family protein [Aureimonas sp. AU40]|uniref:NAD-dependent epimerase/dehydratase family protein n=1 Tax=Aureimonas sp. AU40 TaxID=1637747 RepID=UPI0007848A21|nr:NAD-dependent epimerase/dehydratase family protein [Aureimonas sp. AU40]